MTQLFGRVCQANVGGLLVEELRMQFKAEHTPKSDPNKLELAIWNLSADSRAQLAHEKGMRVQLVAGYQEGKEDTVFLGDVTRVSSARDGPNWVTSVEGQDGIRATSSANVSLAFREGAKLLDVIKGVGQSMLVDIGNLAQLKDSDLGRTLKSYANGGAMFGNAKKAMDRCCRAGGLDWRVQDGVLEVAKAGVPYLSEAVELSPGAGLIGSPEPGENGTIRAQCLIQPGLKPRRKVKIKSAALDGFYVIQGVAYTGDTHGQEWYAAIEAVPL